MKILNEDSEQLLRKLLDKYKIDNYIFLYALNESPSVINDLIENGMLKRTAPTKNGTSQIVVLTQNAKYYFENKERFLKDIKEEERRRNKRYWITTSIAIISGLISLGALVVAIIALCKQ